ncbi:MAG: rod shape-determining protein RodA [Firmicutes bacterium]|nr:rod shape-determining protein RodA [Bacillota bacterium]
MLIALLLMAFGVVAIASATKFDLHDRATWGTVERQLLWVGLGLAWMAVVASLDYHVWPRWAWPLYAFGLGLLALVLVAGVTSRGAARWVNIGPFTLQPAEFMKVIVIVALAAYYAPREAMFRTWSGLLAAGVWLLPPAALVLKQPDLGSTLVLCAITAGLWYLAGMPGARLLALAAAGVGSVAALMYAFLHGLVPPSAVPFLHDYQIRRLLVFLHPGADKLGAGYHVWQSMLAIGSGGLFGQGLANGALNQYDYLPESQTDFIFAVVGEDMGFAGAMALVVLEALLIWRVFRIAASARDREGALLAGGTGVMLLFQLLVNVGMTIGLMPVTGIPLPFISYGGSSLLANAWALGIVLSVGMRRHKLLFGR